MVKCTFCGNMTSTGMHQTRLNIIKKGYFEKTLSGKQRYVPPVAKRTDYYMCPNCVAKGTKWPGARP